MQYNMNEMLLKKTLTCQDKFDNKTKEEDQESQGQANKGISAGQDGE